MAGKNRFFPFEIISVSGEINKWACLLSQKEVFQECSNYKDQKLFSKATANTTPLETNTISYVTQIKHNLYELRMAYKE